MPFTRGDLFEIAHFPANTRPKTGSKEYQKRVVNELFAAFKNEDETLDEDSFKGNPLVIKEAKHFTEKIHIFWKDSRSNKKTLYKHHGDFLSHVIDFSGDDLMEVEEQFDAEEHVAANDESEEEEELRAASAEVEPDLWDDVEEELEVHHFIDVEEEMDLDDLENNDGNHDIPPIEPTDQQEKFKAKHRSTKFRVGQKFKKKFGKEAVWLATKQELRGRGNWAAANAFDEIKEDKELAKKVCEFIKTIKNQEEKPKVDATDCLALLYDRDFSEQDWNVSSIFSA